jgi:hypothetical protein
MLTPEYFGRKLGQSNRLPSDLNVLSGHGVQPNPHVRHVDLSIRLEIGTRCLSAEATTTGAIAIKTKAARDRLCPTPDTIGGVHISIIRNVGKRTALSRRC